MKAARPPAGAAVPVRFGRRPRRLDRRASSLRATGRLAENGEALRPRRRGSPDWAARLSGACGEALRQKRHGRLPEAAFFSW